MLALCTRQNKKDVPDIMRDGGAGKVLDFFTNDLNTTLVRSVEFKNTRSDHLWSTWAKKRHVNRGVLVSMILPVSPER